jgi:superfamily II DNA/RNA helicase
MAQSSKHNNNHNGGRGGGKFTLDGLMDVLAEQESIDKANKDKKTTSSSFLDDENQRKHRLDAIHQFYRDNWMLSPISPLTSSSSSSSSRRRVRPIPDSLYKCELSAPLTTLKIKTVDTGPGGVKNVVEEVLTVPVDDVQQVGENQEQQHGRRRRRPQKSSLGGGRGANLTKNIEQFTRGQAGRVKPFTPGGVIVDESIWGGSGATSNPGTAAVGRPDDDDDSNEHLDDVEKILQRSMKVFEKGMTTQEAWSKGYLLTAPPGVDFTCGLSYDDVYGRTGAQDDNDGPAGGDDTTTIVSDDDDHTSPEDPSSGMKKMLTDGNQQQQLLMPTIRWDQNFLDDDSLFGSSIASSEDDDDDDDADESGNEGGTAGEETPEKPTIADDSQPPKQVKSNDVDSSGGAEQSGQEEVDVLLEEMTRTEAKVKGEFQPKDIDKNEIVFNPLELAKQQQNLKENTKRKSWASDQLLPIDDFDRLIPNPAMKYPFTLDGFQQQAVARLERNENVFVAAHTSAGKTVVAEYAVALARQRGTRCIYTSPIKALSNQKFRDFSLKFGAENVGIVTGDLQINVDDSTVLIMTTEILRSMLYRGADLIRDIESVVFDEVHYINDTERGVVWEEVIIMLPSYVNLIFLSATTPNTFDFSDWIGRTKQKPVYVVKTNYRPVPLSHFLWSNLKLHKIKEGNGSFLDKGYTEAKSSGKKDDTNNTKGKKVVPSNTGRGPAQLAWQQQGSKAQWMSLVRFLEREGLTPTVIFTFSQKKCEEVANMLRSLDLNTAAEGSAVLGFTLQTVARLSPSDARLPQVLTICEMVKRGLGVHHGGLLPILKEMVEILFSRGLVKVLFATETFAMGVNMPAKSVVFNSIRKHDGKEFRVLQPGT